MRMPIFHRREAEVPIPGKSTDDLTDAQTIREDVSLQLHPVPSRGALLVKIQPPQEPAQTIKHVPCDIVLVIDISGSMGGRADVPGEDASESAGLTVLDLVKHGAMTIIQTLDEGDRLGVVVFGSDSKVVQGLTVMTEQNKEKTRERIRNVHPRDATNLWHGIQDGIKVFREGGPSTRVPSIMVLTDGRPNFMCPPQGYVPKLRKMLPLPAAISTFGFGYNLSSGLLKSIAEIGGGSYAFIPDAGMIGTVFVHAVANLQSTFATNATLELEFRHPMEIEETTGHTVDQQRTEEGGLPGPMRIHLGNLQYGQSRDIFLRVKNIPSKDAMNATELATVTACLSYEAPAMPAFTPSTDFDDKVFTFDTNPASTAECSMMADSPLPDAEVDYHESRSRICAFLASIFPVGHNENHEPIPIGQLDSKIDELNRLITELPSQKHSDAHNKSLVEDLSGRAPRGQISLAISRESYFQKWGMHYLPSLLNAHTRQACNSFKDPGPLQYGADSLLFVQCRDALDQAFDSLPAPTPSLPPARPRGLVAGVLGRPGRMTSTISMSRYRDSCGVCFAGSTPVELASGRRVAIRKLRRGVRIQTPRGPRKVAAVLKTAVQAEPMCRVGGVLVTPWHPVSGDSKTWAFPAALAGGVPAVRYTGFVYSVMLQRDGDPGAHGMRVGGFWGVTLGHGLVAGPDVRAHRFFGDWNRVAKALMVMGCGRNGMVMGKGVERDRKTGRVVGFRRASTGPKLGGYWEA